MNAKASTPPSATPSAAQREALRAALLRRRASLSEALALHQGSVSRVQHARDLLLQDGDDAPARDADREVDLALNDHETRELAALDAALLRLDSEGYGRCVDCGNGIPMARLQAAPEALRCIACETALERRQGTGHPPNL
jgi:DnaK suppressor protein